MKKIFLNIIMVFTIINLQSQDLPTPKNIQSPNAASLGKYGDVPISYYTGAPNISIPL